MTGKICKTSLFSAILATVAAMPADARVITKNSNRSYADAYNQVNAMRYQQEYLDATATNASTASATANLPVMVDDEELANAILNSTSETTTISTLESCAMIYPTGVFRWGIPESGVRRNQTSQCIAVVELKDANSGAVLATTTLAAGDTMKCNIDMFPESGMNESNLSKIELPADAAPTMEDVEAVMNEEQKQNAGLKIAAGTIIAGVAGNLLAPKEAGDTKLFGTGKTQLLDTAGSAVIGAGIMAASTYSGKVAGDTIKSTAVNAASGAIVGNMLAGAAGESVLATEKCTINSQEYDCIAGKIRKEASDAWNPESDIYLINKGETKILKCTKEADGTLKDCTQKNDIVDIVLAEINKTITNMGSEDWKHAQGYTPDETDTNKYKPDVNAYAQDSGMYLISSAKKVSESSQNAYAVFTNTKLNAAFGYTLKEDWKDLQTKAKMYYERHSNGEVGDKISEGNVYFTPLIRGADDGALVDFSNQARSKGTLIGSATGGAIGGLSGYQGAKSEITDRWTSAVREYNDSLSNFVCTTGSRFLAKYNDYADVPELKQSQE